MPHPSAATPEELTLFRTRVLEGHRPSDVIKSLFAVTSDAEASQWATTLCAAFPSSSVPSSLSKRDALTQLTRLAYCSDDEEIRRKAIMDLAKLQSWVHEGPTTINVQSMSYQDVKKTLQQHRAQLTRLLHDEVQQGDW